MADRPILFSGAMIRAILAGRKTQTRRLFQLPKWAVPGTLEIDDDGPYACAEISGCLAKVPTRINVGDRLWVREAWRCNGWATDVATIFYSASEGEGYTAMCEQFPVADKQPLRITAGWRPSIHMPRWASRLSLTVTDVRVERLQDISEQDAVAEGCFKGKASGRVFASEGAMHLGGEEWANARDWYADLWDSINDEDKWDANPWVAAYTFTVQHGNIDQIARAA